MTGVDPGQLARLEQLAELYGCSVETLLFEALTQYLEHQESYAAAVRAGLVAADDGDLIPHEAVMDELRRRFGPGAE